MPHYERAVVSGRITDVFAHRFVIEAASGRRLLADLGPKGAETFALRVGLEIDAEGEQKPSELKVDRIAIVGQKPVGVVHKPKPHHGSKPHASVKPDVAVGAVRSAGYEPLGTPRRKPQHFEVLVRRDGAYLECHVELDGRIRKEKSISPHDEKWADDIKSAA